MNQVERKNELLEAYIMAEGWTMLWSCILETRKALGIHLELTDVMGSNVASMCVLGAWMKRIGSN